MTSAPVKTSLTQERSKPKDTNDLNIILKEVQINSQGEIFGWKIVSLGIMQQALHPSISPLRNLCSPCEPSQGLQGILAFNRLQEALPNPYNCKQAEPTSGTDPGGCRPVSRGYPQASPKARTFLVCPSHCCASIKQTPCYPQNVFISLEYGL